MIIIDTPLYEKGKRHIDKCYSCRLDTGKWTVHSPGRESRSASSVDNSCQVD